MTEQIMILGVIVLWTAILLLAIEEMERRDAIQVAPWGPPSDLYYPTSPSHLSNAGDPIFIGGN